MRASSPTAPLAALALLAALSLTGCGGASDGSTDAGAATEPPAAVSDGATERSEAPSETPSTEPVDDLGGGDGNDLCAVLTGDEVASVVGDAAVDTALTFGSLDDAMGGQCVWATTDGSGTYLEIAAWPADSLNPAPGEAPAPGSGGYVTIPNGAYFADANHSFRLAVTGVGATDTAMGAAAQTLAQEVQARR